MSADFRCKGGAVAGVGGTFRYAAGGEGNVGIHESFRNDPVSGFMVIFPLAPTVVYIKRFTGQMMRRRFPGAQLMLSKQFGRPSPF